MFFEKSKKIKELSNKIEQLTVENDNLKSENIKFKSEIYVLKKKIECPPKYNIGDNVNGWLITDMSFPEPNLTLYGLDMFTCVLELYVNKNTKKKTSFSKVLYYQWKYELTNVKTGEKATKKESEIGECLEKKNIMKINDLRIGNYVFNPFKRIIFIEEIHKSSLVNDNTAYSFAHCKPIPLTKEILLKASFKGRVDFVWNDKLGVQIKDEKYYLAFKDMGNVLFHSLVEIQYLHELQNIYRCLTKQELKINI